MAKIVNSATGLGYYSNKAVYQSLINSQDYVTTQIQNNNNKAFSQLSLHMKQIENSACSIVFSKTTLSGSILPLDTVVFDPYNANTSAGIITLVTTGPTYIFGQLFFKNQSFSDTVTNQIGVLVNNSLISTIAYNVLTPLEEATASFNVFYYGNKGDQVMLKTTEEVTFLISGGYASNQLTVAWQ